ncbi:phage tail protein [Pseudomonas protegens]|uniref:phage tail protein n=1 Tax=Pseudomonas protegens TaxID=380021 RepID=UPI001C8E953F|nr:phage tail protein [Pseudomonas protegens]QZI72889.1 phage tail protein [Pseudomonas protegens]
MAIETFTWCPKVDPVGTVSFRTRSAKFGDGYEQVARDGINNRSQSWPLTFIGSAAKIKPIMDFIDARGGINPFYWSPPLGEQGLYRCSSYQSSALGAGMYSLVATFEQAFHP